MSGQIFLYVLGGRTLWVPRHAPQPNETKPVCMLHSATPIELSRSFYLFDYPVDVVEDPQLAAMRPNAKTPNEVLAAVNDFRRVCAENQSFLLQRCYNPQQQPQQQQHSPMASQQHNSQGSFSQPQMSPDYGMGGRTGSAGGMMDNTALLTQLLQQQQQQQQQPNAMLGRGSGSVGSYPDMTLNASYSQGSYGSGMGDNNANNNAMGMGIGYGRGRYPRRDGQMYGNNYNNNNTNPMMMMQGGGGPGGYNNNNNNGGGYGMGRGGMMYGANNANNNAMGMGMGYGRGRYPRRDGQMYGTDPMMMMQQQQQLQLQQQQMMMMANPRQRGGMHQERDSRTLIVPRVDPDPIQINVEIPEEIKSVYMNTSQPLVLATMPGPHVTVWLREHPFPTDRANRKYCFGREGLSLMLKATYEDVKDSKPVEIFPKQICTHYFIYGNCGRADCMHEHHTDSQLRELIAARHVELKAMSKQERHKLSTDLEQKEKDGLAATEAARAQRLKAAQERRDMRSQGYAQPPSLPQQPQPQQPAVVVVTPPAETALSGGVSEATLAKLGITDSDNDESDDDDEDASASSVGQEKDGSASDAEKAHEDTAEAKKKEEAKESEEEAEEEEEEEEVEEAPKSKKRARAPAPKKTAKRAKK